MATIVHLSTVHPRFDVRIYGKQAQTLAARLPHRVIVMVADGNGDANETFGRVSFVDIGDMSGSRLRRALKSPPLAFQAIRRLNPTIVHFHDPELIPLGILLRLFGYVVIYDVHEDVPAQILTKGWLPAPIRGLVAHLALALEWFGGQAFSAIVAATPKIAEHFPICKTIIVQNYPIGGELMLAERVPYDLRPHVFVYPGVIAEIRGAVEMIQAVDHLVEFPDARLDLAGGFEPENFSATLHSLSGWRSVKYYGQVSRIQLATILGNARAGLVLHHPIPNEIEAQPLKMFEYMSVGLPIIASNFPLWRRIIESANCGLLVDPLDPDEIAQAMRWILNYPEEAKAMGQRGLEAVETTYNWNSEAAKLIALYNELL